MTSRSRFIPRYYAWPEYMAAVVMQLIPVRVDTSVHIGSTCPAHAYFDMILQ